MEIRSTHASVLRMVSFITLFVKLTAYSVQTTNQNVLEPTLRQKFDGRYGRFILKPMK